MKKSQEPNTFKSDKQSVNPEEISTEEMEHWIRNGTLDKEWNIIMNQLEEQAEEEKRERDEQLAEEEIIYEEQKKIEEERDRIKDKKLDDLLKLNLCDCQEEDDDVFYEEDELSSDSD